jgi:hypothetical protein
VLLENSLADVICCYTIKMKTYTWFDPLMKDTYTSIRKSRLAKNSMKYRHHNFASARIDIYIYLALGQNSHAALVIWYN